MDKKNLFVLFLLLILFLFTPCCLVLAKICGPLGGHNYECPADWDCNLLDTPSVCTDLGAIPGSGAAQTTKDVNACCKIKHTFKYNGIEFKKGTIVGEQFIGEEEAPYCFMNGAEIHLTCAYPCSLSPMDSPVPQGIGYYKNWGTVCIINVIYNVIDLLFYFLVVIAAGTLFYGVFRLVFAFGDPEKIKKGRRAIIYVCVALILGLITRIVPLAVIKMLGG